MATLDQYQTFPVWIVTFEQSNTAQTSVAASLAALVLTWVVLMAISAFGDRRRGRRTEGKS
jgi:ABC-type sulfate transport system permease component